MKSCIKNLIHSTPVTVKRGRVQSEDPNTSGGEEEGRQRQGIANNQKQALFSKAENPKTQNSKSKLKSTHHENRQGTFRKQQEHRHGNMED